MHCWAEGKFSAGKQQAPSQSITCTRNGPANEQAHVTKASLLLRPVAQLPSCAPRSICITIHGGSGAAPQPNSWPLAKWIISPFCPHVWLAPLAYSSFSLHSRISCAGELQRHSKCSQFSPSPAVRFAREYMRPGKENENRSFGAEPLGREKFKETQGNEVGWYHLKVDLGTGVALNTGVCENAALDKLARGKKINIYI